MKHNYTIKIEQDTDAMNPRTNFDNAGTMVCFHMNYELGDKHNFRTPDDFEEFLEHELFDKGGVKLPLYLYDHSGITISTKPFSCRFDSGQVGYIYMTQEKMDDEKMTPETALKCLESEVKVYDQYLTGDVYGFVITNPEGEEVDSCWGFYGEKACLEEAEISAQASFDFKVKREKEALEFEQLHMAL